MITTVVAMPNILDPMYWIGPQGLFASAVLPTILAIVFVETGLLFPLLPGESLLFTGGLLAAHGTLDIWVLAPAVALTAILGDQTGYFIGRRIGPALFKKEDSRFFKQHHVTESHAFFEKYGPAAIILARFMPFVRTFTPVVAGVSYMRYPVYLAFDIVGGILWGGGVTVAGYFLGNVPFIHQNLEKIVLVILFVSHAAGVHRLRPGVLEAPAGSPRRRTAAGTRVARAGRNCAIEWASKARTQTATLKSQPVLARTSATVTPGCNSMSVRPCSGSTSKTHRSVMIMSTTLLPVMGSVHCLRIFGLPSFAM